MPRINLLPWREQQRRERRIGFYVAMGGAMGLAVVVAFAIYLLFDSTIDSQEARNTRLRAEIRVLDKQIEEINDLQQQKANFISRMQIIEKLQRSRPEVVHLFDQLVKVMPDGVYLTSIKQTGNQLKLEGVAQSSTRVSTLMRSIAASQWLQNPALEVIQTRKDGAGNDFTLDAQQISTSDSDDLADSEGGSGAHAIVRPNTSRPAITGLTR